MNREQFVSLPSSVALGILWDASPGLGAKLADVEPPKLARSPKYDQRIRRKDGFAWASECDLEGLRYWHAKASEPARDPKYTEKNAKEAKALSFWIAWRLVDPFATWSGERNREQATARPPAGKPTVYSWEPRAGEEPPQESAAPNFDDEGEDSDIPF